MSEPLIRFSEAARQLNLKPAALLAAMESASRPVCRIRNGWRRVRMSDAEAAINHCREQPRTQEAADDDYREWSRNRTRAASLARME